MLNKAGGVKGQRSRRGVASLAIASSTTALLASAAMPTGSAAYTWTPAGEYYAVGRETVSTPGGGTLSCDAFWNLEVTKDGQMRVLQPGAPLCSVAAYELPWPVTLTGPDGGIIPKVLFQGTAQTFCRGKLKVTARAGKVVLFADGPMVSGCSFTARLTTDPKLHIVP